MVDGAAIPLSNNSSGTTPTNSLSYSVAVASDTATVTLTNGTLSPAATQTLIDGMAYSNDSNNPSTPLARVVTITSLTDDGGVANSGDDTASLSISTTVSVARDPNAVIPSTDLIFVLDRSNGTSNAELQEQIDFATSLVQSGIAADTRVGIIEFSTGAKTILNFSNDHDLVEQTLAGIQTTNGLSHVDSGVELAIAAFEESSSVLARRAMILLAEDHSAGHSPCALDDDLDDAAINRAIFVFGDNSSPNDFECLAEPGEVVDIASFNSAALVAELGASVVPGEVSDLLVTEDTASDVDLSTYDFGQVPSPTITVTLDVSDGAFSAPADGASVGAGVTEALDSGTITLVGAPEDIDLYLDTTSSVQYTPASNASGDDVATLTIGLSGDGDHITLNAVNIDVTAVNDVPTVSGVPSDVTVTEDTGSNVDLSSIVFADVDGDTLTITLTASSGTFSTPADGASTGAGVTETLIGDDTITLAGVAADINTYLDTAANIQYTGAMDVSSNDAATIAVTGTDGVANLNPSSSTISLDIANVNDAPTLTGTVADLAFVEDVTGSVDLSNYDFEDVDDSPITVTLSVSDGTFTTPADGASIGSGVTETLVDSSTITLVGLPDDIDTYLDTASNIQYTGSSNTNGEDVAVLTTTLNDGQGSGDLVVDTVNIDISSVNDAPTGSGLPADITVSEGVISDFDISSVLVSDLENDSLRVILVASTGTFTASDADGVSVTGSGTGALELTGTSSELNTFFDTSSNLQYTNANDQVGDDSAMFLLHIHDGMLGSIVGYGNVDVSPQSESVDLEIDVVASNSLALAGASLAWTVSVTNRNAASVNAWATGVEVQNVVPQGLDVLTATTTNGVAIGPTWKLTEPLAPGATASLTIVASVSSASEVGDILSPLAYIAAAAEGDVDSTPGSRDVGEDDADQYSFTVGPRIAARPSLADVPSQIVPTVTLDGGRIIAVATAENDVVEFRFGDTAHSLNISGHAFEIDAATTEINIGGSGGFNTMLIVGSDADESGWTNGPRGSLTNGIVTVNTFSFDATMIDGAGGANRIQMFGSNEVDSLVVLPHESQLVTPLYEYRVTNAERIDVYGRNGADTATLVGTPSTDTFIALDNQDQFRTPGRLYTAKGFQSMDVYGGGGQDRATLHDSADDDSYTADFRTATMSSAARVRTTHDFVSVIASSINGGVDQSTLNGASGYRDVFRSSPSFSEMVGARNLNRTEGFAIEFATSDDDLDVAEFIELSDAETLAASASSAQIQGDRDLTATGFQKVSAEHAAGQAPNLNVQQIDFVLELIGDWI